MAAPLAFTTLRLDYGALSVNLVDGVNYMLQEGGYAPQIPLRHTTTLGGPGLYAEVEETITVNVYGATAAACHANLQQLTTIIDAAIAWQAQAQAPDLAASITAPDVVLLVVQPQGSTRDSALTAVVTGASRMPQLPATWNDKLMAFTIPDVEITITRRVLTPPTSALESMSASAANAGTLVTLLPYASVPDIPAAAQFTLQVRTSAGSGSRTTFPPSFLCIASVTSASFGMTLRAGTALTTGSAPWSSFADTANLASGGAVLRYTPTGTTAVTSAFTGLGWGALTGTTYTVLAKVRSSSASVVWDMRIVGRMDSVSPTLTLSQTRSITGSTAAQVIALTQFILPSEILQVAIQITASATGATLDIDSLLFVPTDAPTTAILAISETPIVSGMRSGGYVTNGRWWTGNQPGVWMYNGANMQALRSTDRADVLQQYAVNQLIWYAVDGGTSTKWEPVMTDTGGAIQGTWTLARAQSYLAPE